MKRVSFLFIALFLVLVAFAGNPFGSDTTYLWIVKAKPVAMVKSQKQFGSLADLINDSRLYCFYYTDDAFYRNQPITDTREEFYNENRLKAENEICFKFIDAANEELSRGFYLTGNKERISRYILKLHVISVDPDGETSLYAMVFDTMGKKLIYQKLYNANGGHFGSLVNLMGDAAERLGKKVGKDIKKNIVDNVGGGKPLNLQSTQNEQNLGTAGVKANNPLACGNSVYLMPGVIQEDILGTECLVKRLKEDDFWKIVSSPDEANFIMQFRFNDKGSDHANIFIYDRDGALLDKSQKVDADEGPEIKEAADKLYNKFVLKIQKQQRKMAQH